MWTLVAAPAAQAASSASYQISSTVVDAGGGTSASPSHQLTACIGSEIAGASSSASYRVDTGCGPSALAIASDFPLAGTGDNATPIPALSGLALALLVVVLAAAAMKRLRASPR
jgi:hypothetical protein